MKINLKREIKNFRLYSFYQPLIEAITNSLQANANTINISFTLGDQKEFDGRQKINSFSVKDDGDGFTENNIKRFIELGAESEDK